MTTKLTLTIDPQVIEKAKIIAHSKKKSLSSLIENYLKSLIEQEPENNQELSPIVKSLKGSIKIESDFDYKKELKDALAKKYV